MFKLKLGDLWRGLVMAILAPVTIAILGVFGSVITSDFDVFSLDFIKLFKELTNVFIIASYSAGSTYLLKNLITDDNGDILGIKTKS
jgi:hypothetical protein